MLFCPSCAHENPDEQKFCGECGTKLKAVPIREERKVITALFCDLVGSTALGERLDPEDIARLLRSYQQICQARIESHGGVVEKFIGDAVVGVFGVPLAHEDDPERAVRAALRITEDIGESDLGIEVRIGVNTGEALVRLDVDPRSGQGFATGDTMNTAARLEAAAPVMGVAVGASTYGATRTQIIYEGLEPIVAKGKVEPVAAWKAIEPVARVGTPERDRTPFVGREIELSMLTQLFERSRTRPETGFATIVADPGLGKSRLVRELGHYVETLPELVIWREGRCLPYGDGISFWALGEIVKAQSGILETDDQRSISMKLDQAITEPDPQTRTWIKDRLAPLVGLETDTTPPQQEEAFTAWRRFLEQLAASGPTVLVVEDLHWADPGVVAFLTHLAERTSGLPLLVLATARPEVEERHPSWPPGRRSTVLSLSPLDESDLETLVASSLPGASPELTRLVLERAGGSPLYAEQLAAMIAEQAIPIAGGTIDAELIPTGVQALIAARIDALPPEPKQVLMQASVVGKTFWSGAIRSLGEHQDLDLTLSELCRRELCRPIHPSTVEGDHEFGFWHALVRDVAYAELTKTERARMHAATARWIADRTEGAMGEDAEIVVHHIDAALEFALSAPELDTGSLAALLFDALIAAGEAAMHTNVPRAIPYLERATSGGGLRNPREVAALLMLGRAYCAAGRFTEAVPLLERSIERSFDAGDLDEAVRATIALSDALFLTGEESRGDSLVEEMRGRLGAESSGALSQLLAYEALNLVVLRKHEAAVQLAEQSIAMAADVGIDAPLLALATRGIGRVGSGNRSGEADVRGAIDGFLREGDLTQGLDAMHNLAWIVSEERLADGLSLFEEAIDLAERLGATAAMWGAKAGRLTVLARLGRFDDVLAEADSVLAWATDSEDRFTRRQVLLAIAQVDIVTYEERVDLQELIKLSKQISGASLTSEAWLAFTRGDLELARSLVVESVNGRVLDSPAALTPLCIELGLRDLGQELLVRDETPGKSGEGSRAEGRAALAESSGEFRGAADGYAEAAAALRYVGSRPRLARALTGLGRSMLWLGEFDEGTSRLNEARALYLEMKALGRVAEIDELLATVPSVGGPA